MAVSAGPPTSEPESDVRRLVTRPLHPCWGIEVRPALGTMDARVGRLRTMVGAGDGGTAAGGDGPDGRRSLSVRQAAFIGVGAMVGAGIFALLGCCRRGGRCSGLDLVPPRRRRRRTAGLLVRQVRGPVPLGRRLPRVRHPGLGRGPLHRRPRLAAARGQRDHHRDGRGLLRQLRQRGRRRQRRLGEAVRGADPAGDVSPEHPRLPGRREGADRGRRRRRRHPDRVLGRHPEQPRRRPARVLGVSVLPGHRLERGADLLRLPRLRRHHLHRQGPRRPEPPAAQGDLPGARHRHRRLRRRRPRRLRHADRRRGDRLRAAPPWRSPRNPCSARPATG